MNKWLLAATHTIAAAAGFGIGYVVLKDHYKNIADEEIQSVTEHYMALVGKTSLVTGEEGSTMPDEIAALSPETLLALKERFASGEYVSDSPTPPEQQRVLSIFEDDVPDELVVLNQLLASRDHALPYVITYTEFMDNDSGYEQISLTYWAGDNTLAGEDEQIIPDIQGTIGGALSYFGIGSEDKDTVYVRVESSGIDFEVVKDDRRYGVVVHGAPDPDEEPQRPKAERIDKMRGDD